MSGGSHRATVRIVNRLGLHARPAAHFVRLAGRFAGVMKLAAEQGARIEIRAEGEDAPRAVAELVSLVERGFDEDDEGRPVREAGSDDA